MNQFGADLLKGYEEAWKRPGRDKTGHAAQADKRPEPLMGTTHCQTQSIAGGDIHLQAMAAVGTLLESVVLGVVYELFSYI